MLKQIIAIMLLWGMALLTLADALPHNEIALEKISQQDPGLSEFSFVVMGDNRDGDRVLKKIIGQVNQDPSIAFSLDNGDLVPDGYRYQFRNYLEMISDSHAPLVGIIGNHEIPWYDAESNYKQFMGKPYFSFAYNNSYFIVLDDSSKRDLGEEQENWLKDELEKSRSFKHRFVFMHVPLYDPRKGRYKEGHSLKDTKLSKKLNDLFDHYAVDMLFCSHIHAYYRGVWQKTPYIISGGAGAPLKSKGFYHYIKVDVLGEKVAYELIPIEVKESSWW